MRKADCYSDVKLILALGRVYETMTESQKQKTKILVPYSNEYPGAITLIRSIAAIKGYSVNRADEDEAIDELLKLAGTGEEIFIRSSALRVLMENGASKRKEREDLAVKLLEKSLNKDGLSYNNVI